VVVAFLAIAVTSCIYEPWAYGGPILCPMRAMTGLDCPGCGLTRSFCALAHGRLIQSVEYHCLGPLFFAAMLAAIPLLVVEAIRRRKVHLFHRILFSTRVAYTLAAVLVMQWTVRMVLETRSGELILAMQDSWMGGAVSCVARFL
jgi:hypothetical protein